jgi:hypothetical protein
VTTKAEDLFRIHDSYYRIALFLVGMVLFLGPLIHCIKLLRFGPMPGAIFFYVSFPLTTLFFGASYFFGRKFNLLRPNLIEISLFALISIGLVNSLIYQGTAVDIMGNILRLLFSLFIYHTTRRYKTSFHEFRFGERLAQMGLWGVITSIAVVYILGVFGPYPLYLGLGTGVAFPALAYQILSPKKNSGFKTFGILLLFILGGKRGPILSAFLMYAVGSIFFKGKKQLSVQFLTGLIVLSVSVLIFTNVNLEETVRSLPRPIAARVLPFFKMVDRRGFDNVSSGRSEEVLSVFREWKADPLSAITGRGFGATFIDVTGKDNSTVHISPIALWYQYGIFGLVFFFALFLIPLHLMFMQPRMSFVTKVWCLVALGSISQTLSLYTFFQDPIIWISVALITAENKNIALLRRSS